MQTNQSHASSKKAENVYIDGYYQMPANDEPVFRLEFPFTLPVPAGARLVVDPDHTRIEGGFTPAQFDVIDPPPGISQAEVENLSGSPAGLRVTLDTVRHVVGISITGNFAPGTQVQFYRLDGDQLSANPTTQAPVAAWSPLDFTDQRFALVLTGDQTLTEQDLAGLTIYCYPAAPRVSITGTGEQDQPLPLWSAPGEMVPNGQSNPGSFLLEKPFADAVERLLLALLDRENPPPASVEFKVIAESDAPCLIDITDLTITTHLVQETFPGGEAKQVLRYSGKGRETQEVTIELPGVLAGDAPVVSATLKVSPSFRSDLPAQADAASEMTRALADIKTGVEITALPGVALPGVAGQVFTPAAATILSGISLALMATSAGAELSIELVEDSGRQPAGRVLAEAKIKPESLDMPTWCTAFFKHPVILAVQGYWLVVKASRGGALWMLADKQGEPVSVFRRRENSALELVGVLDPLQALFSLLAQNTQPSTGSPESGVEPMRVAVGECVLPAGQKLDPGSDKLSFDLKDALNTYIAEHTAQEGKRMIPLTFASALPGLLTVYPPKIVFDAD